MVTLSPNNTDKWRCDYQITRKGDGMKMGVCEQCGKDVCIYDNGAIHGGLKLYVQNREGHLGWIKWFFGTHKGTFLETEEGCWCDHKCFSKWVKEQS